MLLADAEKLALELMAQFGLLPKWRFEFDDAVRRFGCCHRSRTSRYMGGRFAQLSDGGKITLSRELVSRNDREQVEDTIRHEIAHALCPPKCGHGSEWKAMCARTGANPERCYDHTEVDAPKGDWQATCRGCGRVHTKFRRPKRELYCAAKDCKAKNPPEYGQGRFNPICKLVWRHKDALPDPSEAQRKKAIEAMKARLRAQEPESIAASEGSRMPTEPELTFQCVKCDRQSISFHVTCPVCSGDMMPASKLQAEKESLKKRIAELERKAGK